MKNEILTEASRRNLFLSQDAVEYIESAGYDMPFITSMLSKMAENKAIITKQDAIDFLNGDKGLLSAEKVIPNRVRKKGNIKILPNTDITGNSTCEATVKDFANYMMARYVALESILKQNKQCHYRTPIAKAKVLQRDVCIIGMVYEITKSRNGHTLISLEDESGTCTAFINKDDPLANDNIIPDEVIGVLGRSTDKGLFIVEKIIRPSVPKGNEWIQSDSKSTIACISDIHIGSKQFLQSGWDNMTKWLKYNADKSNINYMIIAGDVVDGIGAYPGQEEDLLEMSIYKQYEDLAEQLKDIPDDIEILLHPGNHDACRLAEPQPALKDIYTKTFDSNISMTGNPISVSIEGRVITSYHGKSIDDWINLLPGVTYDNPVGALEQMIERRHLAPIYGKKNALAPESKDYLALTYQPEILITGHIHSIVTEDYKGVKLINASTYQSQTAYQIMHNFKPKPCVLPLVHLGTGRITCRNFLK